VDGACRANGGRSGTSIVRIKLDFLEKELGELDWNVLVQDRYSY
jgi:hypothetical protein